jgi:hypothetical protein
MTAPSHPRQTSQEASARRKSLQAQVIGPSSQPRTGSQQGRVSPDRAIDTLLAPYLDWLAVRFAPKTAKGYLTGLRQYQAWLDAHGLAVARVTSADLTAYQRDLAASLKPDGCPYSADHQMQHVTVLKSLYGCLVRRGVLLANPTGLLAYPRVEQRLPRSILTKDEARRMVEAPDRSVRGLRDRARALPPGCARIGAGRHGRERPSAALSRLRAVRGGVERRARAAAGVALVHGEAAGRRHGPRLLLGALHGLRAGPVHDSGSGLHADGEPGRSAAVEPVRVRQEQSTAIRGPGRADHRRRGPGHCHKVAADRQCRSATSHSNLYLQSTAKDNYGAGTNKCSQFVADTIQQGGAPRPQVPKTGILGWFGFKRDPTAHEWADPAVDIPGWSSRKPASEARPGDVIAQAHGNWGHAGIVVAPGLTGPRLAPRK